jgi:CBS domain-containing protein
MICPACGSENIDGSDRCENCLSPFRDLDVPRADAAEGLARSVMEDKLSRLDYEPTITVPPGTPAIEVAKLMKEGRQGCALVLDEGRLVGIFTEHDVLTKLAVTHAAYSTPVPDEEPNVSETLKFTDVPSGDIPLEEIRAEEQLVSEAEVLSAQPLMQSGTDTLVSEVMSKNPEALYEGDSVAAALNKMSLGRYRHLPVKRSDGSYTVASIKSVLKYIAQEDW